MEKSIIFIVKSVCVASFGLSETAYRSVRKRAFSAIILLTALWGTVPIVSAQYLEEKVDESLAVQKNTVLGSGNKENIQNFARNYYLARWTLHENLRQLHSFRRDMGNDVASLAAANKKICQDVLIQELAAMAQREDIFPAVRYNAALAAGMFNEREAGIGGSGDIGVPYAPALTTLFSLFAEGDENGGDNRAKTPDYVVLAVLINLERYAALGISNPEDKKKVTEVFIKVLEPSFGKERNFNQDVVTWMQLKAVGGLSAFASPSDGGAGTVILDTFIRLLKDKSIDNMVQGMVLRGIGTMNFDGLDHFDYEPVVAALARYSVQMSQKEVAFIDEENIRSQVEGSAGRGGAMGGGMLGGGLGAMSGMGGDAAHLETVTARVKFDLESLKKGISGENERSGVLARLTKDEQIPLKNCLESMVRQIDRTVAYIDFGEEALDPKFDPKKVRRSTRKNAEPVFMVNSLQIREFIADEMDTYQDLADSLSSTDAGEAAAP